ncbi:MAG: hypothetical protein AAF715_30435, partial [Myxococcota bacterium]
MNWRWRRLVRGRVSIGLWVFAGGCGGGAASGIPGGPGPVASSNVSSVRGLGARCEAGERDACVAWGDEVAAGRQDAAGVSAPSLWMRACRQGDDRGCQRIARARPGLDEEARFAALDAGCGSGSGAACAALGRAHATGAGQSLDHERARERFDAACRAGDGAGCAAFARRAEIGLGGPVRPQAAAEAWARGCTLGDAAACIVRGRRIEQGDRTHPPDPAGAFERYRRARALDREACEGDDAVPAACGRLGALLREGSGGPVARREGRALQTRACLAGDARG